MKSLLSWFVLIVSIAVIVSSCADSEEESTDKTTSSSGNSSDNSTSTSDNSSSSSDSTAPTVISFTTTADNQSAVAITDNMTVTFSEAMDTTTVTTNTSNTTCSGTIRVSSNSFSSCVQMSSSSPESSDNITFTLDPSDNLTGGTTYLTRVTTGVKDTAGNAMSSQYDNSTGFTTVDRGLFVVQGGQQVSRSWDNGTTWSTANLNSTWSTTGLCYGNGTFVIVGDAAINTYPLIAISRDKATSFDNVSASDIVANNAALYSCEFGNGVFFGSGRKGHISSDNGSTWQAGDTTHSYDVAFGNNVFAKVTNGGAIEISTDNASNFSATSSNEATEHLFGVTFGNNVFVAVGDNGQIVRSTDNGSNWDNASTTSTSQRLYGVGYGNGVFVAGSTSGVITRSTDNGDTWDNATLPSSSRLNSVAYGNGTFLVTESGGWVLKSTDDGLNWTRHIRPHSNTSSWNRVIFVKEEDL